MEVTQPFVLALWEERVAAPSNEFLRGQAKETVEHFLFRREAWPLLLSLGGQATSDGQKWTPNMDALRATIRFAITTAMTTLYCQYVSCFVKHRCLPPWTFAAEIRLATFVQEVFEHMLLGRRAVMVEHCERIGRFRRDVRLTFHEWMTTDPVLGGLPFTMKGLKSKHLVAFTHQRADRKDTWIQGRLMHKGKSLNVSASKTCTT
ncbi:hypothetical protein FMUND_323 [Fusarium mundagurra]|uniref:Uncharacterized protein n=1 Tax=Fusarium mundagurra TaxID=1567541 RepID=A0A8H6DRH6_9HYPO|nr:hypothetical protein FMUND_323 [Fusarium mundagurra]